MRPEACLADELVGIRRRGLIRCDIDLEHPYVREVSHARPLVLLRAYRPSHVALDREGEASDVELQPGLLTKLARERLDEQLALLGAA